MKQIRILRVLRVVIAIIVVFSIEPGTAQPASSDKDRPTSSNPVAMEYYQQGQYLKALEMLRDELKMERERGNRWNEGRTLNNIGVIYLQQGWYDQAQDLFREVLTIAQEPDIDDEGAQMTAYFNLGTASRNLAVILQHQGISHEAREACRNALNAYRQFLIIRRRVVDSSETEKVLKQLETLSHTFDQGNDILPLLQEISALLQTLQKTPKIRPQPDNRSEQETPQNDYAMQAAELAEQGKAMLEYRQYDEAETLYRQAITIYQENSDLRGEGETLRQLTQIYSAQAQHPPTGKNPVELWQQAIRNEQLGLALLAEIDDDYNRKLAGMRLSKGGLNWDAVDTYGLDMGIMLDTIQPAFFSRVSFEDVQPAMNHEQLRQAEALGKRGNAYVRTGDYDQAVAMLQQEGAFREKFDDQFGALDTLERTLTIHEQRQDLAAQEHTMQKFVKLALELGYTQKALSVLQRIQKTVHLSQDYKLEAAISNRTGIIKLSLGQFAEAERAFLTAEAIQQTHSYRKEMARTYNNRGLLRYMLGQYAEAGEFFHHSLVILSESDETADIRREAAVRHHLALLFEQQGRQEESFENSGKAQQHYETAQSHLQQALAIMQRPEMSEDSKILRALFNNLGVVYYFRGKVSDTQAEKDDANLYYEQALQTYQKALQQAGNDAGKSAILHNTGMVYVRLRQHDTALRLFHQVLDIEKRTGNIVDQMRTLAEIGSLYEQRNDYEKALAYYLNAIEQHETIRHKAEIEEFKISFAEQSVDVYQQAILLLMEMNRTKEAFNLSEHARARGFLDLLGNMRLDVRSGIDPQLRQVEQTLRIGLADLYADRMQERAKPLGTSDKTLIKTLEARIEQRQKLYNSILQEIQLKHPEYASLISVNPLKLEEVQQLLDPGTTLLSYFVTPDLTVAFVIAKTSFETVEISVSEQDLRKLTRTARQSPATQDAPPPQSLRQLYDLLVAPVNAQIENSSIVGIIPHSVLHKLPFAALIRTQPAADDVYFGDEHQLFSLPSAGVLRFVRQKQKDWRDGNALVVGYKGYPPLKYSESEASNIAGVHAATALIGDEATKAAVTAAAGDAAILHLSTHAQLSGVSPLFAEFQLKNAPLTIHDIYGLELKRAALAVLSACNTQIGQLSRGDDMIAMNRAFIYAGAPSVIASLWSVDDKATSELMVAFHQRFARGESPASALSAAQRDIRKEYPQPYYWAGFVLTGDPGQ